MSISQKPGIHAFLSSPKIEQKTCRYGAHHQNSRNFQDILLIVIQMEQNRQTYAGIAQ